MAFCALTSCSSSSDELQGNVEQTLGSILSGSVLQIGDYTLSLYDDNSFDAVNNKTNQLYAGRYTFEDPHLTLSQITSRAFTLEPGKVYTFKVERTDNGSLSFTDTATGEIFAVAIINKVPSRQESATAQSEKEYIKSVLEELETYAVAKEWSDFTDVARELQDVNSGELDNYLDDLFKETMSQSPKTSTSKSYRWTKSIYTYGEYGQQIYVGALYSIDTYVYRYEYYDRVLMASQAQGEFVASYNGSWKRTSTTGDLKLTYTDKNGTQWVLKVQKSGSIGKIKYEDGHDYYYPGYSYIPTLGPNDEVQQGETSEYTYQIKTEYMDLPQHVTAILTRDNTKRVEVKVNISKFTNINQSTSELSFVGNSNGTAYVYLKPNGDAIEINSTFNYANGSDSNVSTTMKKGTKTLLEVKASCIPTANDHDKVSSVANANATATILDKLTVRMSTSEGKVIADAYNDARSYKNRADAIVINNSKEKINSSLTAYLTNGSHSAQKQADFIVTVKSKDEGYYDYSNSSYKTRKVYELIPAIKFSDGSSYAFENYFTESFFKSVIDYAEQLGKDFERMVRK